MVKRRVLLRELNDVFKDVFDNEEIIIEENMQVRDVEEWDSLIHMVLIATIEEEFKFKFTLDEINNIDNIGSIIDVIERRIL